MKVSTWISSARRNMLIAAGLMSLFAVAACESDHIDAPLPKVGVIYVVHGGTKEAGPSGLWDSSVQIFGYDPHSFVYQNVIWNPAAWPRVLTFGNGPKELGKYGFEYARIGGTDPFVELTDRQLGQLKSALEALEPELGVDFVVELAAWIPHVASQHANPRMLYEPGVEDGSNLTYCGSPADGGVPPDGTWPGCDPERFNTDGVAERLIAAGVDRIIVVDMTVGGVRFSKTFDVVSVTRDVVNAHNSKYGTTIRVDWVNDPTDLLLDSYPDDPPGWTVSLGPPKSDRAVPIDGRPNPVAANPDLAELNAKGIEASFSPDVSAADTGVMLLDHAIFIGREVFDPKIDDTLVLLDGIRDSLLARNPGMDVRNIVGGWAGTLVPSDSIEPRPPTFSTLERTREMRGENLGHAVRYETDFPLPDGQWGYRYWDALAYLKDRGVKHIVVAFPQIVTDSVLNLVELPNQIGKEIGFRTWLDIDDPDYETYPGVGHPFADYWGIWVDKTCEYDDGRAEGPCCFEMGGCKEGRPYPPPRQTPIDRRRDDNDPSLAWDVSEYGHLGYDAALGAPDPEGPVQDQYTGTWAMWRPPNASPGLAALMADEVADFIRNARQSQAATNGSSQ